MVADDGNVERARERLRQPVALLARSGVDDRRSRRGVGERRGDPARHRLLGRARHDGEGEVGAVEAGRHLDRVAQPEALDDVARHLRRRGRGRRDDRPGPEPARGVRETKVVRPEVVAPLRHAMRLVDDEQTDRRRLDPLQKARRGEPLRCHVQEPQVAAHRGVDDLAVVSRVLLRVDEPDAARSHRGQRLDLVLHQRHERRHHEREIPAHQRRELVTQRLARAGRHDDQDVAIAQGRLDRVGLPGPERVEAEKLVQRTVGIGGLGNGSGVVGRRFPGVSAGRLARPADLSDGSGARPRSAQSCYRRVRSRRIASRARVGARSRTRPWSARSPRCAAAGSRR